MAKTLMEFPLPEVDFGLDGEELLEEIVEKVGDSGGIVRETRFCEGQGAPIGPCYTPPTIKRKEDYKIDMSPFPPLPVPPVPPVNIPPCASENDYMVTNNPQPSEEWPPLPILIPPGRR